MYKIKLLILILAIIAVGGFVYEHHHKVVVKQTAEKAVVTAKAVAVKKAAVELASHCASNTSGQVIIVSVSAQHLWACSGSTVAYDNPVITGMEQYPADLTPTGTYKITGKLTDQTLAGHD